MHRVLYRERFAKKFFEEFAEKEKETMRRTNSLVGVLHIVFIIEQAYILSCVDE